MNGCSVRKARYLEPLLWNNLNPDLKWNSYIRSIAEDAEYIIGCLYAPINACLLLMSFIYTSDRWTWKYTTCVIYWQKCPSLYFPISIDSKCFSVSLWVTNNVPLHRRKVANIFLLYPYSHGKCSDEQRCLLPPVLTITTKTRCVIFSMHSIMDM